MRSPQTVLTVLASVILATTGGLTRDSVTAAPRVPPPPASAADRVRIQADVNGMNATVQPDGTLAPGSAADGPAAQFDLYDLGKGLMALRSVESGRYVTARDGAPLLANSVSIGDAAVFRQVGGARDMVRLRAVAAQAFVCADEAGYGVWTSSKRCPNAWQLLRIDRVDVETEHPAPFAITAPVPGSVLLAATAMFSWDGIGEEHWLRVGTAPGATDVYASDSLGPATSHTVTGLPLNGATLFVEVHRRVGTTVDVARGRYTAPIRRGLAIITDFADRRLEDWTGGGISSVGDLSEQLLSMEQHWGWLSRGLEIFAWDVIRIELPRPAVADAYPGWDAFRDAAITLARQQVQTAEYDVNSDGIIDAAWLVVSSGDVSVPFAIGGMSRNAGANLFVDGQASLSVRSKATGNFTHEVGHCLGLPDLYGTYSTIGDLTVMGFSWWLPPADFSAYERIKLGWVTPQIVSETRAGVWLPSANDHFAAVMIPTIRPSEYFLIEYRAPPSSGFGSVPSNYRGLAVYHVLEGSSMWQDPPLVKLEPADGSIQPEHAIDPHDFLYPENPAMRLPMMFRSYYHDGDEVFRIDSVAWRNGGLAFDIVIAELAAIPAPVNLLVNPSFEYGEPGRPTPWQPGSWVPQGATFEWPSPSASDGQFSARLETASENDMWWSQRVTTLVPGQQYLLCGTLKGEDIEGTQGNVGGNVSVLGGFLRSEGLWGTFDWTKRCVQFTAQTPSADVACRMGFYGSTVRGRLWCDDFTLERVGLRSAFGP
jgi:hypothetical protein